MMCLAPQHRPFSPPGIVSLMGKLRPSLLQSSSGKSLETASVSECRAWPPSAGQQPSHRLALHSPRRTPAVPAPCLTFQAGQLEPHVGAAAGLWREESAQPGACGRGPHPGLLGTTGAGARTCRGGSAWAEPAHTWSLHRQKISQAGAPQLNTPRPVGGPAPVAVRPRLELRQLGRTNTAQGLLARVTEQRLGTEDPGQAPGVGTPRYNHVAFFSLQTMEIGRAERAWAQCTGN